MNQWEELVYLPTVKNTNRLLLEDAGVPPWHGVYTLDQEEGRGTKGRIWKEKAGENLALSLVVDLPLEDHGKIPLVVGLGAALLLQEKYHLPVGLKWPNDLLLEGKKLGGILCESRISGNRSRIVAGIGINLFAAPEELLDRQLSEATSLAAYGTKVNPHLFARELFLSLVEILHQLKEEGFEKNLLPQYKEQSVVLHQLVRIQQMRGDDLGKVEDICADGSLLVQLDSGERKQFYSGDTSVRPHI